MKQPEQGSTRAWLRDPLFAKLRAQLAAVGPACGGLGSDPGLYDPIVADALVGSGAVR